MLLKCERGLANADITWARDRGGLMLYSICVASTGLIFSFTSENSTQNPFPVLTVADITGRL
jgi:hypothetical protein